MGGDGASGGGELGIGGADGAGVIAFDDGGLGVPLIEEGEVVAEMGAHESIVARGKKAGGQSANGTGPEPDGTSADQGTRDSVPALTPAKGGEAVGAVVRVRR